MNFDKLKESIYTRIRLRPKAQRLNENSIREEIDDIWILISADRKHGICLRNIRTNHELSLNEDHVHHFTTDSSYTDGLKHGFLELCISVFIHPNGLDVEPIMSGPARLEKNSSG